MRGRHVHKHEGDHAEHRAAAALESVAHIGVVDNWHPQWRKVLQSVQRQGELPRRLVQADGWLPARENLLVAFVNDDVAGHLCFRVEPTAELQADHHRHRVEAEVDSFGIDPAYRGRGLERALRDAAVARARELNCGTLRGFEVGFEPAAVTE